MKVAMRTLIIAILVMVSAPAAADVCRLAEPPAPRDPAKKPDPNEVKYESPSRQLCEDELVKDQEWWFNLEERLGRRIHRQAAQEITTNNRHVAFAYAAMWLLAVGFVVMLWRRQQALKAEIERLARELKKAEGS